MGDIVAATEVAIKAAKHLTAMDKGALETLRFLAKKIETEEVLRDLALDYASEHKQKPPSVDNVSIPTYLKFCESLGLTPAGRVRLDMKKEPTGGSLAKLRSVKAGKSA